MAQHTYEGLLRKKEVLQRTGLSNSTFYARIRDGSIKPGVPVGPRIKAWPTSEIQAFIQSCITARDQVLAGKMEARQA
ncbi:Prophage CP4-57 regulatory protein (AlpA) [compost metagenome]